VPITGTNFCGNIIPINTKPLCQVAFFFIFTSKTLTMKHFYPLSLLVLLGISANAQIVNIPDANLKNALVNTTCATLSNILPQDYVDVDANNDGEIQESEAAAIYSLALGNYEIASLEGIVYFTNLKALSATGNALTTVDLSNMPQLEIVKMADNQLTTLSFNSGLKHLEVPNNLLTEINFPANSMLQTLDCTENALTALDISTAHFLDALYCHDNQLTSLIVCPEINSLYCSDNLLPSLDLSSTTGLLELNISNNQLTEIQIPPTVVILWMSGNLYTSVDLTMPFLYGLECRNTPITSLTIPDFHAAAAEPLDIRDNANLQFINLKNLHTDYYTGDSGGPFFYFYIQDNPNLEHICFDQTELDNAAFLQTLADLNNPDLTFSSYCNFVPGQTNTVSGNIRYDFEGNGCSGSDAVASGVGISFGVGSNVLGETYTNGLGNYVSYFGLTQTLSPQVENPYYTVSPASYTATFTDYGNNETVDFCIMPNGVYRDLDIMIFPLSPARPGFDAIYKVHYENKGTETQSGTVSLVFEDYVTDFVSANPAIASQVEDLLSWDFVNLAPFESREIMLTLNVNSPLETPAVNIGHVLNFTANVSSDTDETPADNTFNYEQIVVGSYDPNDKIVSAEIIDLDHLDDYLYYTIRFQNTGTFYAENVVVKDMLSANLDLTTLQMVSASHAYRSTLTNTNQLEFFFDGINLPAVGDDEPGSHGYVTFKVKPISDLPIFAEIDNEANIYFDFNAPITTNLVTTMVYALGIPEFDTDAVVLYPNPVRNTLSIQSDATIETVSIYNTLGQLVKTVSGQTTIDVSELSRGSYIVQVTSDKGKANKKLIKL
jgi:uncharacterized repeat protein (TIGR01451 family)